MSAFHLKKKQSPNKMSCMVKWAAWLRTQSEFKLVELAKGISQQRKLAINQVWQKMVDLNRHKGEFGVGQTSWQCVREPGK